jgi:hypothetical protein
MRKEYPKHHKKKKGYTVWSHVAWEMPSKTRYCRKNRRKDSSDGKTRKKRLAATG